MSGFQCSHGAVLVTCLNEDVSKKKKYDVNCIVIKTPHLTCYFIVVHNIMCWYSFYFYQKFGENGRPLEVLINYPIKG